jgi:hypothetical protein
MYDHQLTTKRMAVVTPGNPIETKNMIGLSVGTGGTLVLTPILNSASESFTRTVADGAEISGKYKLVAAGSTAAPIYAHYRE